MTKTILAICTLLVIASCNRSGEIKVINRVSRTTMENVYWGDVYVGGSLRPGQETAFTEVKRSDAKLPVKYRIYYTVGGADLREYYTEQKYALDKNDQLVIELSDSTVIYELE